MIAFLRILVELLGWLVFAPVAALLIYAVLAEAAAAILRRRCDIFKIGRLGFLVRYRLADILPCAVMLADGTEWEHRFDRWYWRV